MESITAEGPVTALRKLSVVGLPVRVLVPWLSVAVTLMVWVASPLRPCSTAWGMVVAISTGAPRPPVTGTVVDGPESIDQAKLVMAQSGSGGVAVPSMTMSALPAGTPVVESTAPGFVLGVLPLVIEGSRPRLVRIGPPWGLGPPLTWSRVNTTPDGGSDHVPALSRTR